MTEELVHYATAGAVATLTLDSQHNRNALSRRLVHELLERLDRAEHDRDVRVVLLRAEGPTFCSGADLAEAAGGGMDEGARALVELQRRIAALEKPVVSRVHGNVRAGGIGIVAASDVAISAGTATYAFTEVRLGLAPAVISLAVLPRMTSRGAAWAFLTGEVFDGTAAAELGLVTRAVPEDRLDDEVRATCDALAQGHPQGLSETKRLLGRDLAERIDASGEDMRELSARLFASEAAREAMRAFLARRR